MLEQLISDPDWDRPFFKKLSHNDTGIAAGHQGGIVIPKDVREFLPGLNPLVTPESPTVDSHIRADLVVDGETRSRVATRYQFQTWGSTRSPESRLTGNLGELRNAAVEGDYVVFQRNQEDPNLYRLILVGKESEDYSWIEKAQGAKRWGLLTEDRPLSEPDIADSRARQEAYEKKPFSLFDPDARFRVNKITRLARSIVFRQSLIELYKGVCSVCRAGLRVGESWEVEGAHIVPRHRFGCDDARNGLALCRTHHWAFDMGLFSVDFDYRIIVPDEVLKTDENKPLADLRGVRLLEPKNSALAPSMEALEWHRDNTLFEGH